MKNINNGAEFLNLVFKDMTDSIKSKSNEPSKRITEYLERLERIHGEALTDERKLEALKAFYYEKYVIKSLPESYIKYRKGYFHDLGLVDKKELTEEDLGLVLGCIKYEQRKSLDQWLDYLFDPSNNQPTWFKYYVFQGISKVGVFYPILGDFTKRSASTTAPFIPVEPEVINNMYSLVSKVLDSEPLTPEEQEITAHGLNFRNLYSNLYTKGKKKESQSQLMDDDVPVHEGPAIPDYNSSASSANVYQNHQLDENGVHIGSAIPDYNSSSYDFDSIPQENDDFFLPPFEEEKPAFKK